MIAFQFSPLSHPRLWVRLIGCKSSEIWYEFFKNCNHICLWGINISSSPFGRIWEYRSFHFLHFFINWEEPHLTAIWISVQQRHCFLHNEHILAASHCCLALGKRCHWCSSGGGAELETSQSPLALPGSRSDQAVWKRKVFPSLQRERETLWFKARETGSLWESEGDGYRDGGWGRHTKREREWQVGDWLVKKTTLSGEGNPLGGR